MALYAKSYVADLIEARDVFGLQQVVAAEARQRALPEEFWLFGELLAWSGSTRSGVWQYYESVRSKDFKRALRGLKQFGLDELARWYENGRDTWKDPEPCQELDQWLTDHEEQVHATLLRLIAGSWQQLVD
jgi:hypothetical protein